MMPAAMPGDVRRCEACGVVLTFAATRTGKVAPIVVEPHDDGNVLLARRADGTLYAWTLSRLALREAQAQGVALRRSHFADCPAASRFRS